MDRQTDGRTDIAGHRVAQHATKKLSVTQLTARYSGVNSDLRNRGQAGQRVDSVDRHMFTEVERTDGRSYRFCRKSGNVGRKGVKHREKF